MPSSTTGAAEKSCTIAHRMSVVSMPSRATDTKPMITIPQSDPVANARSISPSRVRLSVRPARCIQKIIHVTRATASRDIVPPMISVAWNVSA